MSFKVYQVQEKGNVETVITGKVCNVASRTKAEPMIEWNLAGVKDARKCPLPSHQAAAREMLAVLHDDGIVIDAVGHRFVHGGDVIQATTRIDTESLQKLRKCLPLAPIHNPNSFSTIEVCLEELPGTSQFAVIDTAFHASMPMEAREYALPRDLANQYGLRKWGFHGLSYQYVSGRAAALLNKPINNVKLIMCHLGTGGSSACAFEYGHSVETSMGYFPLTGLVMSTRCGDLDAEAALELVRQGMTADEVSHILNNESGLIGLSGYSSNLAEIMEAAEAGNEQCRIANEVYANRLKHYLGAYTWLLNGADVIVFTDDIGVSSWKLRKKVCGNVTNLGVQLDIEVNRSAPGDRATFINHPDSRTKLLVLPTDEERVILEEVMNSL